MNVQVASFCFPILLKFFSTVFRVRLGVLWIQVKIIQALVDKMRYLKEFRVNKAFYLVCDSIDEIQVICLISVFLLKVPCDFDKFI